VPTYGTEMNTVIAEEIPLDVKLGAAWKNAFRKRAYAIAYDADLYLVPAEGDALSAFARLKNGRSRVEHHAGAEVFLYPEFPLRIGVSSHEGFSCGAGLYFADNRFHHGKLDYVFTVEPGGSGMTHGVSWTQSW
jgi:hypothetical protein